LKKLIKKNEYEKELYLELKSGNSKKYLAYNSIKKDLDFVNQAVNKLIKLTSNTRENNDFTAYELNELNDSNRIIIQSLYFSSIIIFGKAFTDATTGRKVKLEKKEIYKLLTTKQREVFDEVISLRHNYIAHAGDSSDEQGYAKLIFEMDSPSSFTTRLGYSNFSTFGNSLDFYNHFLDVVKIVVDHVKLKIKKWEEKINKEYEDSDKANSMLKKATIEQQRYLDGF